MSKNDYVISECSQNSKRWQKSTERGLTTIFLNYGKRKNIKTSVLAMKLSSLKLNELINFEICITLVMFYILNAKYYFSL